MHVKRGFLEKNAIVRLGVFGEAKTSEKSGAALRKCVLNQRGVEQ
jgi:hypothetical protein